jgi:hypothetical protein
VRRPAFAFLGILACVLLAANALLTRLGVASTGRIVLPIGALAILGLALERWWRA